MHHGISERPRELRWYHAAGMLFGDWGTSRLYVLGLAFYMSAHASFWYVAAMCVLVSLVGYAYTIICAHFPDGGGVYSAAKTRAPILAVIGALLLIADYVVTAALSAYEGFRYILPVASSAQTAWLAGILAIGFLGILNVVGPRRVGVLALIVALLSGLFYLVIGIFCVTYARHPMIEAPTEPIGTQWAHFVNVILALSGVEAIANMTGVMAEPVAKNAKRAILAVLAEVVILNLVMGYAMNALPELLHFDTAKLALLGEEEKKNIQDHMVRMLASTYAGPWIACVSSIFFGLLLLSASNTAMGGMVSVQYLLSRDKELPRLFTALNGFGVPWVGLVTATALPAAVLLAVGPNTERLADLYAIGVVGAITINLLACGTNAGLDLTRWERVVLLSVGGLVLAIEITLAWQKPPALMFACSILGLGLLARQVVKWSRVPELVVPVAIPAKEQPIITPSGIIRAAIPLTMPRLLVPTRGNKELIKFATSYAKDKKAAIFVLFVREIALAFRERDSLQTDPMTLATDTEAQQVFSESRKFCEDAGVPMIELYAVHDSPAELILDHAATLGADAVLMGVSQRNALWKTLRGDVLQEVIRHLPKSIPLLIHA